MRLKIITPVPNVDFLAAEYRAYLADILPPGVQLDFQCINSGYPSIEAYAHTAFNSPETIRLCAQAQEDGFQGIFLNCYADPAILACREFLRIPVFGAYVPSILGALSMAEVFGIITINEMTRLAEQQKARLMGVESRLAAMTMVDIGVLDLRESVDALLDRLEAACRQMWNEHRVGAVVLGCTGMQFIIGPLRARLAAAGCPVQVVEPFAAGVSLLEYTVRMGRTNALYYADRFIPPRASGPGIGQAR